MEQPFTGHLRRAPTGGTVALHLRGSLSWSVLLGPVVFLLVLLTPNPIGRDFPAGAAGSAFAMGRAFGAIFWLSVLLTGPAAHQ